MPVLWLCGPPGVGKTTVGWAVYAELVASGLQTGYVDIDQLGICYPEPESDPGRYRMKSRNLAAVVAGMRTAGCAGIVVSGVVDPVHGAHLDELRDSAVSLVRLRADADVLLGRLGGRRGEPEATDAVLREAQALDGSTFADSTVDSSRLAAAEVVRRVIAGWRPRHRPYGLPFPAREEHPADPGGAVLWLYGATAVGKSSVGFRVYQEALRRGLTAAFVDLSQIDVCGPTPAGHAVRARILGAMWRTYREAGARAMVVVGPVDERAAAGDPDTLSGVDLTLCRLHAGRDDLTARILARGRGEGWREPGDSLVGRSADHLRRVADAAVDEAQALDRHRIGHRVDTSGRTPEEAAGLVLAASGWLTRAGAWR